MRGQQSARPGSVRVTGQAGLHGPCLWPLGLLSSLFSVQGPGLSPSSSR